MRPRRRTRLRVVQSFVGSLRHDIALVNHLPQIMCGGKLLVSNCADSWIEFGMRLPRRTLCLSIIRGSCATPHAAVSGAQCQGQRSRCYWDVGETLGSWSVVCLVRMIPVRTGIESYRHSTATPYLQNKAIGTVVPLKKDDVIIRDRLLVRDLSVVLNC